jgi:hypothetical protein
VCFVDTWLRLQFLGLVEVYRLSLIALVMETVRTSETSVHFHETGRRYAQMAVVRT